MKKVGIGGRVAPAVLALPQGKLFNGVPVSRAPSTKRGKEMDLIVSKNWVESPEYHSLSAPAKLALWEVLTLVQADKPAPAKDLAFKLRVPVASLEEALSELKDCGFAVESEGLWSCQFHLHGKAMVKEGGNRARQAQFQAKLREEKKSGVLAGEGGDMVDGQAVPVKLSAPREVVDYQAVLELFSTHCPKMPQPRMLTAPRQRVIKTRWLDFKKKTQHGTREEILELFTMFFETAGSSPYLNGECNRPGPHEKWIADLDFLFTTKQFMKVVEGSYSAK